ncbi:hypothetical protein PLESTM_001720200 [Pleodorina starrii]|nr:hypothetical protein PLESTM_001720200 [Pleodorina starrii]
MKLHAFPILTHLNGQARLPVPPTPRQRIDSCGMRGFVCHARHHAVNNPNDFNSTCPTTQPIADADCPALRQPAPHPPTAASSITALPRSTSSHPSSPSLEPSSAASFLPSASPGSPLLTPASSSSFSSSRGSLPDSPPLSSPGVASRRVVLQAGASAAALLLLLPAGLPVAAAARLLHSRHSAVPCSLTVRNRSPRQVEARWVNFDGDEEPYATILPGHVWTVDTYETHPWRFRDASTGDLVCEYVAQRGDRLLQLYDPPADLLDPDPGSSTTTGEDGGGGSSAGDGEWRRRQRRLRHRRQSERYDQPQLPPDDQVADQVAASDTSGGSSHHQSLSQPPPPPPPQQQQQQQQHPQHPQQQQHLAEVSERPGLAGGFDGLGNPAEQYTAAALLSVVVLAEEAQAVVVLGLEGRLAALWSEWSSLGSSEVSFTRESCSVSPGGGRDRHRALPPEAEPEAAAVWAEIRR